MFSGLFFVTGNWQVAIVFQNININKHFLLLKQMLQKENIEVNLTRDFFARLYNMRLCVRRDE